jgi:hypothetical protein
VNPYYAPPAAPPPGYGPQMPGGPAPTPPVWPWYVAYAILMAIMYLLCAGGGTVLAVAADRDEDRIQGIIMAVIGMPLLVLYGAAPLLPKRPWAWTFHLVLIGLAATSACCTPVAIPLFIFWLKPETKAFFGKY